SSSGNYTSRIAALADGLVRQITQKSGHSFDAEFLSEIAARTEKFKDPKLNETICADSPAIAKAFRDKGLSPLLGLVSVLAFNDGQSTGQLSFPDIPLQVIESRLLPGESLFSLSIDRSAEIAAAYFKELVNIFGEDDFIYAIACYGMTIEQAGEIAIAIE